MRNRFKAITIVVLVLAMNQAYSATEIELINQRSVDGETQAYSITALFEGAKSRYTFNTKAVAPIVSGTYLVSLDNGKTNYYINRNENTCYHGTSEEFLAITSDFLLKSTKKFRIKSEDGKVNKIFDKDAAELLGLPTRQSRIDISFTASYKYMLFNDRYRVKRMVDVWLTPKGQSSNTQVMFQRIWEFTGDEQLDQKLREILGTGHNIQLRSEINQTMTDKKGKQSSTQILQYVESIRDPGTLPASTFELPECVKIDARKMEKNFKSLLKKLLT